MRKFIIEFSEMTATELPVELTPVVEEAIEEVIKEYDEEWHEDICESAHHIVTMTIVSLYVYARYINGKLTNTIVLEDAGYIDKILITMRNTEKIKWREVK